MRRRTSSLDSEFAGFGAIPFWSVFSCAVDGPGQKVKIARDLHKAKPIKPRAFVFTELARRFERKRFSLNMFNPSAADFLGATSSSPPGRMFRIQPTRLLCNCLRG